MAAPRPSQLVRDILLARNVCQIDPEQSWRCFTVLMPDGIGVHDDAVVVADREDIEVGRYLSDSNYRVDPHIQIIVRGCGLRRSYDKINEIALLLDTGNNFEVTFDGHTYVLISAKRTTNIQYNGLDATGRRFVHSIEYDLILN